MERYAPTKAELLLATEKAKEHIKNWGGPSDTFSTYLTAFVAGIEYVKATPSPAKAEQEGLQWLPIDAEIEGWQLCRLKGTTTKFPLFIAPNVIVDFAGKFYKRHELEYVGESTTPPVKEVDKEEIFEFIAWILEQGYKIVESQTGPCFQKGTEYSRSVRWLYREFRKMEPAPVKEEEGNTEPCPLCGAPCIVTEEIEEVDDHGDKIDIPYVSHTYSAPVKEAGQPDTDLPVGEQNWQYFERVYGKGDSWTPMPAMTHNDFRHQIELAHSAGRMTASKEQPAPSGLRWVKGAPSIRKEYHAKVKSKVTPDISWHVIIYPVKNNPCWWWAICHDFHYTVTDHEIIEYLDESDSPAPVQVDPVKLIEWLFIKQDLHRTVSGKWYCVKGDIVLNYTHAELLNLYTQSLQLKP